MYDLDETIRSRRSVRGFLRDRPVPRDVLLEALELAQRAPSNCNVQPWRLFIASGKRCDLLRHALTKAAEQGNEEIPSINRFTGSYRERQVECAVQLYGCMGIERSDREARRRAMLRNFVFFDAPHVAIVCMESDFGVATAVDVGAYLQTLMLALWSRGVASCAQASLRSFPTLLKQELEIPDSLQVLCGLSFGYEDSSHPANATRQARQPLADNVEFRD